MSTGMMEREPEEPGVVPEHLRVQAYGELVEGLVFRDVPQLTSAMNTVYAKTAPFANVLLADIRQACGLLLDNDIEQYEQQIPRTLQHLLWSWVYSGHEILPQTIHVAADYFGVKRAELKEYVMPENLITRLDMHQDPLREQRRVRGYGRAALQQLGLYNRFTRAQIAMRIIG